MADFYQYVSNILLNFIGGFLSINAFETKYYKHSTTGFGMYASLSRS